jgi:hypothetical protein
VPFLYYLGLLVYVCVCVWVCVQLMRLMCRSACVGFSLVRLRV